MNDFDKMLHLLPALVEMKAPCDDVEKKRSVAIADCNSGDCFFISLPNTAEIPLLIFE